MTQNEISYRQMLLTRKSDKERNAEASKHNRATEAQARDELRERAYSNEQSRVIKLSELGEVKRRNLETERQGRMKLAEDERSHKADEFERNRSNVARETEQHRSNIAREYEENRSNVAKEVENHRANVQREWEEHRKNVTSEGLRSAELSETAKSHRAQEIENNRNNLARNRADAINAAANLIKASGTKEDYSKLVDTYGKTLTDEGYLDTSLGLGGKGGKTSFGLKGGWSTKEENRTNTQNESSSSTQQYYLTPQEAIDMVQNYGKTNMQPKQQPKSNLLSFNEFMNRIRDPHSAPKEPTPAEKRKLAMVQQMWNKSSKEVAK